MHRGATYLLVQLRTLIREVWSLLKLGSNHVLLLVGAARTSLNEGPTVVLSFRAESGVCLVQVRGPVGLNKSVERCRLDNSSPVESREENPANNFRRFVVGSALGAAASSRPISLVA